MDREPASQLGVLIVDDEADVRLLVRMIIDQSDGMFVSGEAASGAEALDQVAEQHHDVVVLDQMMPGMDGLEAASRILAGRPEQRVVLFSAFLDDELERRAREVGICACVVKGRLRELPSVLVDVVAR